MLTFPKTDDLQSKIDARKNKIDRLKSVVLTQAQQDFVNQVSEDKLPGEFKVALDAVREIEEKSPIESEIKKINSLISAYAKAIESHQGALVNPAVTPIIIKIKTDEMSKAYDDCANAMLALRERYKSLLRFDKLKTRLDTKINEARIIADQATAETAFGDFHKSEQTLYDELSNLSKKCLDFKAAFKVEFEKLGKQINQDLKKIHDDTQLKGKEKSGQLVAASGAKVAASSAKVAASSAKVAASSAKVAASSAKVAASSAKVAASLAKSNQSQQELKVLKAQLNHELQLTEEKVQEFQQAGQELVTELVAHGMSDAAATFNGMIPSSLNPHRVQLSPSAPLPQSVIDAVSANNFAPRPNNAKVSG